MHVTGDELAGVVDLFGGLTRAELGRGLCELAFKQGEDCEPADFDPAVEGALDSFHLVAVDTGFDRSSENEAAEGGPLLVAGPVAFPTLPADATDLPHIMDVPERSVDRADAGAAAVNRFRDDVEAAVADGNEDRIAALVDVSYELEVWAPVDVSSERERLMAD